MYKKLVPFLLLLLALVVVAKRSCPMEQAVPNARNSGDEGNDLNRNVKELEYTRHSLCRMDCRKISEEDVEEILAEGIVNNRKSDLKDRPCPTFAVEGYTEDREHLRVVFAQCSSSTKVVTCINLDEETSCHCPGDQQKRRASL